MINELLEHPEVYCFLLSFVIPEAIIYGYFMLEMVCSLTKLRNKETDLGGDWNNCTELQKRMISCQIELISR